MTDSFNRRVVSDVSNVSPIRSSTRAGKDAPNISEQFSDKGSLACREFPCPLKAECRHRIVPDVGAAIRIRHSRIIT